VGGPFPTGSVPPSHRPPRGSRTNAKGFGSERDRQSTRNHRPSVGTLKSAVCRPAQRSSLLTRTDFRLTQTRSQFTSGPPQQFDIPSKCRLQQEKVEVHDESSQVRCPSNNLERNRSQGRELAARPTIPHANCSHARKHSDGPSAGPNGARSTLTLHRRFSFPSLRCVRFGQSESLFPPPPTHARTAHRSLHKARTGQSAWPGIRRGHSSELNRRQSRMSPKRHRITQRSTRTCGRSYQQDRFVFYSLFSDGISKRSRSLNAWC